MKGGMTIPKIKSWSTLAYIIYKDWLRYMGVSKNTGTPKMDGLFHGKHGKTLFLNGMILVFFPLFLVQPPTHISDVRW